MQSWLNVAMPALPQTRPEPGAKSPQGQVAPEGAFKGLLLQALLGGMPGQAAGVPVLPHGLEGQEPAVKPAGPTAVQHASAAAAAVLNLPAPIPSGETLPVETLPVETLPVETLPVETLPVETPQLVPVPVPVSAEPVEPVEPAPPAEEEGAPADPSLLPLVPMAAVPPVTAQVSTAEPADEQSAPEAAPAPVAAEQSDPMLERFVRKAARTVQTEAAGNGSEATGVQDRPTFQQMVRMVAGDNAAPARPQPAVEAQQPQAPGPEVPALQAEQPQAPQEDEPPQPVASGSQTELKLERTEQSAESFPAEQRPSAEPEQVVRQVSRFLKVAVEGKRSEVRFQLHPEHLGTVTVKLVITEGAVRATMTAHDPAVKAVLEANLDQLRSRLADQGLRVEHVQVTVGGSPFGQQHQQGEHRQAQEPWQQQGRWRTGGEAEPEAQTDSRQPQEKPAARTWTPGGRGARINSLA